MNPILAIVLAIGAIGITLCVFMLRRNAWVYQQRVGWVNKFYDYVHWCIDNDQATYNRYRNSWACDAVADYETMLRRFWLWDLESFVVDREAYEAVMDFHSNPPLTSVPSDDDFQNHVSFHRKCAS